MSAQNNKPKLGQRLTRSFAIGLVLGSVLAILGLGVGTFLTAVSSSNALTGGVLAGFSFAVGFGGSVAVELSKDIAE